MDERIINSPVYRKILSFSRPYALYFIAALLLSVVIVICELAVPVITRSIVDNHITARYHLVHSDRAREQIAQYPDMFRKLDETTHTIRHDKTEYLGSGVVDEMKRRGVITNRLYYITKQTPAVREAAISAVQTYGSYAVIPVSDLDSLSHERLLTLRGDDLDAVTRLGLAIIGLIILTFICTYIEVLLVTVGGQHVIHDMRTTLYAHVTTLPMTYFDTHKSGTIVTRLTNDINNIEEFFSAVFINIFKDVFLLTGIISVLLVLDVKLGTITLMLMPLLVAVSLTFRMRMRKAFRRVREALSFVNARLGETMTGITMIQLFNRQERYYEKFRDDNHAYYKASEKQVFVNSLFNPLISIIRFAGMGTVVFAGSHFVVGGALSLGTLIVFISYLEKFFQPIQDIAEKINIMQSAMASSERIFHLMDEPAEPDTDSSITYEDLLTRSSEYLIECNDVTFSYSENDPVLKHFTLKIRHGESIAIVGHTGCGKTTVISLLSRLYQVYSGTILINGVDINRIPLDVLRRFIGVVQQDVTLFSDTVRKNIMLGNSAEQTLLDTVCEYTNCAHFIDGLPHRYDTVLSEEGMSLSFGERQLISFARVIAYDPAVFVLDEATSNIDTETEILIQDALNRILENKTSIVIAHRLSTIKHCDRIIVMRHGEIVEEGTHTQLLKQEGLYYRLYLLQYKKYSEDFEK